MCILLKKKKSRDMYLLALHIYFWHKIHSFCWIKQQRCKLVSEKKLKWMKNNYNSGFWKKKHLGMSNQRKKQNLKICEDLIACILHQSVHQKSLCYTPIYKRHENVLIFILTNIMLTTTNNNHLWPHNKRWWFNTTTNTGDGNSHTCVQTHRRAACRIAQGHP